MWVLRGRFSVRWKLTHRRIDSQTDRHTQTHTDTHRHTQTHTNTHKHTPAHTGTHKTTTSPVCLPGTGNRRHDSGLFSLPAWRAGKCGVGVRVKIWWSQPIWWSSVSISVSRVVVVVVVVVGSS